MRKPPFVIPSMDEIRSIAKNGLKLVSTFSGCGGSCLGFRMQGFEVLWASEFIDEAAETYRANYPEVHLDQRDIREVTAESILEQIAMQPGDIDVLEGSPPCAAFSTAGMLHDGWGKVRKYSDKEQRVDDLFFEFIRLVDGLRPKMFIAENVRGLARGHSKGYFNDILRTMRGVGYNVVVRSLDAQWLGVPQMRERLIFMGARNDLNLEPSFPTPLSYRYTLDEIFPYLAEIKVAGTYENWQPVKNRVSGTIAQSDGYRKSDTAYLSTHMVRAPDENGVLVKRRWTIDELKILSTFPADFILTGDTAQQWERIGRAVPPRMMSYVAKELEKLLRVPA